MMRAMPFDFDAIVAPFRMQPGLRRVAPGSRTLHALGPTSPVLGEKLAVLRHDPGRALIEAPGFGAGPAWHHLAEEAARQNPQALGWDGETLCAHAFGVGLRGETVFALRDDGHDVGREGGAVNAAARAASTPQGDSLALPKLQGDSLALPKLQGDSLALPNLQGAILALLPTLPPPQRLPALLSLALHEDFAVVDGRSAVLGASAVCLPSHWDPADKVGLPFAAVHAPVADNARLVAAGAHLMALVCAEPRWERFVWTLTPHPHFDQHPLRHARTAWPPFDAADAWAARVFLRTEHQSFLPMPQAARAVFCIQVEVRTLNEAVTQPAQAIRLHEALASMSDAVLAYRHLEAARAPLLDWLARRAAA
jgi:dimethylamine monooxygenase subunit A